MFGIYTIEYQPFPKLLVVEDYLAFAIPVECALREQYCMDVVSRLTEAIEALAHEVYVGVLLDLHLPDSQALGTLKR